MPRQIYPTLLVTSLVLAVVVCLHPSIAEEFLALVGIDLPGGMRHQVQADEPPYSPIPTVPSARYGTVPAPPVEPTSGVRPAGWPAPANVEISGAGAIPVAAEPAQYPPGSYGATGAAADPRTSSAVYPGTPYPGSSNPSPAPTYAGADARTPSGYAPPISNTRPPATGEVPRARAPAVRHWERDYSTQGNPYRPWDAPAEEPKKMYSSWGRETLETPPPYQRWSPPNASVTNTPSAAAQPQGTNRSATAPISQSGTPYAGGAPSTAPVVTPQPTSQLMAQPSRDGGRASYQDAAAPPAGSRYPSTTASPSQAAGAIESAPRYAGSVEGTPVLPPPPTTPGNPSVNTSVNSPSVNPPVNPPRYATPNMAAAPRPQRNVQPAAAPTNEAAGSAPEPFEGAEILARVGSEPILCSEVIAPVNEVINRHRDEIPEADIPKYKRMFLKKHLQSVINTKLIYLDATRNIPEEAMPGIRDQLADFFYSHQLPDMMKVAKVQTRDEFDAYLQALGSSLQRERDAAIENLLAQQWMHEQTSVESKVTHEQMLTYYHDHLDEFSFPAKARWQQLTVHISDYPSRRDAFAAIAQMGNLVMDGAPFEQVAAAHSKGPTAGKGGLRDWTTQGSLVSKKLDQALFGLPVGALSPVIEDGNSLQIVRVLERTDAGREAFVDAQVDIRKKIQEQRKNKAVGEYLAKLRKETRITTVFDNDPTGPVVAQEPGPTTPYRY